MTERSQKRVYVAGKLKDTSVNYVKNLHQMIYWGDLIRREGFAVFIPGIDFLVGLQVGDWDYDDYFDNSQPWLEVSDIMFVVPNSESSNGVQREKTKARILGIPIVDNIADLKYILEAK